MPRLRSGRTVGSTENAAETSGLVGEDSASDEKRWRGVWAEDPSKAHAERVFLIGSFLMLVAFLLGVVGTGLYTKCGRRMYAAIGVAMAVPSWVVPGLVWVCAEDGRRLWWDRFWVKANVWVAIFGFVGNYFWTHYFYSLLGARYTFDTYNFNGVPVPCYLVTHCYFCFYFAFASVVLRRLGRWWDDAMRGGVFSPEFTPGKVTFLGTAILVLSYTTALGETATIAHFPYYDFEDRDLMYKVGSLFYGLYFVVGFPLYWRMDETPARVGGARYTLYRAAVDSLAAAMAVTLLLDFWRLGIGSIGQTTSRGSSALPFA